MCNLRSYSEFVFGFSSKADTEHSASDLSSFAFQGSIFLAQVLISAILQGEEEGLQGQ